ncbi:LAGLIDADG family homing endonuclease [Ferdinandcohnia sp. Marseille-Q9671]
MNRTTRRTKRKRTLEFIEIIKLYEGGHETSEIAELANVSSRYIRKVLSEHHVEMRPFGSWKRQYSLNENYFKEWSNNMAYILGFILADGCISGETQTVTISPKEPEILDKIKKEVGSNQPLQQNKKTGVYLLNLNSKILKEDLITLHGITPNKSLTVQFPNVPKEYLSHFIRGYFDGDGSVYTRGYFVSFVGGSIDFMITLKELLGYHGFESRIIHKGKHYRLYISGRKTIKNFHDWIYENKDIYLERKFNSFPDKDLNSNILKDAKFKTNKSAVIERKNIFIQAYTTNQCLETACAKAGIKKETLSNWIKSDNEFKLTIDEQNENNNNQENYE